MAPPDICLGANTFLHNNIPPVPCVLCAHLCSTVCDSMDYSPPGPLSMEFSRQKYWSGLPFPPPGTPPDPGVEAESLVFLALANGFFISVPFPLAKLSIKKKECKYC